MTLFRCGSKPRTEGHTHRRSNLGGNTVVEHLQTRCELIVRLKLYSGYNNELVGVEK